MQNEPIQSLWIKGRLSTMERLSIKSFLDNGHEFHLYTYEDVEGVPEGVQIKDARTILPESRIFTYQQDGFGKGSYSGFANLFRYQLLYDRGGWWVDCDVVCLRPFDFAEGSVIASGWEPSTPNFPTNCVMKTSPGDPLMAYCLEAFEGLDVAGIKFAETGPDLVAKAVADLGMEQYVAPWYTFCPIGYRQVKEFVSPPERLFSTRWTKRILRGRHRIEIHDEACGLHLWNQMWKLNGLAKDGQFPPASIYEQLKSKHLRAERSPGSRV